LTEKRFFILLLIWLVSKNLQLVHASMPLEPVTGPNGGSYELLDIESPAISPDNQKTAFNAMLTIPILFPTVSFTME